MEMATAHRGGASSTCSMQANGRGNVVRSIRNYEVHQIVHGEDARFCLQRLTVICYDGRAQPQTPVAFHGAMHIIIPMCPQSSTLRDAIDKNQTRIYF
jgi:hypothetical protein